MTHKKPILSGSRSQPPTSADVARAAGVSRTSVSYVLNHKPGHRVPAETQERIVKAARDLRYQPNVSARALRRGQSDEICLFLAGYWQASAVTEWAISIQTHARKLGYTVGIYYYDSFPPRERKQILASIFAQRPAGIIGMTHTVSRTDYALARQMGVRACVIADVEPCGFAPTITWPQEQAAYLVGQHLLARGHLLVGELASRVDRSISRPTLRARQAGLAAALVGHGGSATEIRIDSTIEDVRAVLDTWGRSPVHPTAVYVTVDEQALLLLRACNERGIRVPQDLALIANQDSRLCTLVSPELTSIRFDVRTTGIRAVEMIELLRSDEPIPAEMLVPPTPRLIVRESS